MLVYGSACRPSNLHGSPAQAQAARLAAEAAAAEADRAVMEASRQDLMARITLTQQGLLAEAAAIKVSQTWAGLVLYCPAICLGSSLQM